VTCRLLVLASGSGTLLQALIDEPDLDVVALVTDVADCGAVDRASTSGIPCTALPVADYADRAAWDAALADELRRWSPTWVVSAGFMRILGPSVLAAFPSRIVNTHPSLLPAFAGAHAVADALARGVRVTGCTVHLVDEGVDTGPILAQESGDVLPDDDVATLHERIKQRERRLLVDVVRRLCREDLVSGAFPPGGARD